MLLLDMSEESRVAQILFSARTTVLSLGIFIFGFGFDVVE
jgi:hypothetical protein